METKTLTQQINELTGSSSKRFTFRIDQYVYEKEIEPYVKCYFERIGEEYSFQEFIRVAISEKIEKDFGHEVSYETGLSRGVFKRRTDKKIAKNMFLADSNITDPSGSYYYDIYDMIERKNKHDNSYQALPTYLYYYLFGHKVLFNFPGTLEGESFNLILTMEEASNKLSVPLNPVSNQTTRIKKGVQHYVEHLEKIYNVHSKVYYNYHLDSKKRGRPKITHVCFDFSLYTTESNSTNDTEISNFA